jgi:hypothetical protein
MAGSHPYAILTCNVCGEYVSSDASTGLLVFVRAGETVYEEPPLCGACSLAIGVTAITRWAEEEEEG